jgi:hypothetical protein
MVAVNALAFGRIRTCPCACALSHHSAITIQLWLSVPSGFLVVFEKPKRSSFHVHYINR